MFAGILGSNYMSLHVWVNFVHLCMFARFTRKMLASSKEHCLRLHRNDTLFFPGVGAGSKNVSLAAKTGDYRVGIRHAKNTCGIYKADA